MCDGLRVDDVVRVAHELLEQLGTGVVLSHRDSGGSIGMAHEQDKQALEFVGIRASQTWTSSGVPPVYGGSDAARGGPSTSMTW